MIDNGDFLHPALIQKLLNFRLRSGSLITTKPPLDFLDEGFLDLVAGVAAGGWDDGDLDFVPESGALDLEAEVGDLDFVAGSEVKGSGDFLGDVLNSTEFCVFVWVFSKILFSFLSKYSMVTLLLPPPLLGNSFGFFSFCFTLVVVFTVLNLLFWPLCFGLTSALYFALTESGMSALQIWSISFRLGSTLHKSHVFLHCHCRYFSSVTLETNNIIDHDKPSKLYVKSDHTCSTCRRTCLVRTSSDRSNSSQSPELSYIFLQHPYHEIVTSLRL